MVPIIEGLEGRALLSATPADAALLLQLADSGTAAGAAAIAAGLGARIEATEVPGLLVARGDAAGLQGLKAAVQGRGLARFVEPEATLSVDAIPNDPRFASNALWGLNGTHGIDAPRAWDVTTGSTRVVVADIDTGVDYRHPDLYLNIWLNEGEIPATRRANLLDLDDDGRITFRDLNDPRNQGVGKITDLDGDGRITGADALRPMQRNASGQDTGLGGWADGISQDGNGYVDDLVGWNFVTNTNNPMDDHGHGTHTSGTIAATGNNGLGVVGVAWKALIMPLKFLASNGSGSDLGAARAVRYAADNGARISNNSYSGGGGSVLSDAIAYAATKSHVFVAAAGNASRNIDASPSYPASFPFENIVSVAATDRNAGLASFSNFGAIGVDLGAPGVGIESTVPGGGYAQASGTSMAAPHVAGAAALVLAAYPDWTVRQVKDLLLGSVTVVQALAGRTLTGGILNVGRALAAPPAPVVMEQVWVDDALPPGATTFANGGDSWDWSSTSPAPFSGGLHHRSAVATGMHQHAFQNAAEPMRVGVGDTLFAYVYIDPATRPAQLMLQWRDASGSWEHRAYWGSNRIGWGRPGTDSLRHMGEVPASGGWVRLEVPASAVGLEGLDVRGMAFTLHGGGAVWDRAGRAWTSTTGSSSSSSLASSSSDGPMGAVAVAARPAPSHGAGPAGRGDVPLAYLPVDAKSSGGWLTPKAPAIVAGLPGPGGPAPAFARPHGARDRAGRATG